MAFDGIVIASLVSELRESLLDQKISKIAQPENDELLLTFKGAKGQIRLALSASPSLPCAYLTNDNKIAPLTAPTFCMVLRKHIANGKIIDITQPSMERIIRFEIEHLDELGDLCHKYLIVELMGKHSNIIFCKEDNTIIDSIRHISVAISSVREVLPGRTYFIPEIQEQKKNPVLVNELEVADLLLNKPTTAAKALFSSYTGISPLIATEIAYRAGIDADAPCASLSEEQRAHVAAQFCRMLYDISNNHFAPVIYRDGQKPVEFSCIRLSMYQDLEEQSYDSISSVLRSFYEEKSNFSRIRQKSVDLRKIVSLALERNVKKCDLQKKQMQDANKREKYRLYGELLQAYGYQIEVGQKSIEVTNYYDNNNLIKIPLDDTKTGIENSKAYFDKYNKLKRTAEALEEQLLDTQSKIDHLLSIQSSIDIAENVEDLVQIRQELIEYGFIKKGYVNKKERIKSKPYHYLSSDGYDIYVGKNNYQNDELTFKVATGNDWWFHAKGIPGSHVIVKSRNEELPDRVFEEAAALAGFYSKGRDNDKIDIDYLQKKNVKKPNGSACGFVVYYTNYSMTIHPSKEGLTLLEDS